MPNEIRVLHGYGKTHGVSKTGDAGTGTVVDHGIPLPVPTVSWVCTGIIIIR